MTVPSDAEFSVWLTEARQTIAPPLELPAVDSELSRELAKIYLLEAAVARNKVWERLSRQYAYDWLFSQRPYKRALELLHGRKRRAHPLLEESMDDYVNQMIAKLYRRHEEDRNLHFLRSDLIRLASMSFASTWSVGCMSALAEYFKGNVIETMIDAARRVGPAAQALSEATAEYLACMDALDHLDIHMMGMRPNHSLRRMLKVGFEIPDLTLLPIKRLDERAPERLFVYRMYVANRRMVRRSKTEVIAELMGLEGFRHQYDSRTIERQCSQFTGRIKQLRDRLTPGQ